MDRELNKKIWDIKFHIVSIKVKGRNNEIYDDIGWAENCTGKILAMGERPDYSKLENAMELMDEIWKSRYHCAIIRYSFPNEKYMVEKSWSGLEPNNTLSWEDDLQTAVCVAWLKIFGK